MNYLTHHENKSWAKILKVLADCPNGASARHIAICLGWELGRVRGMLYRMHDRCICYKKGRVWYPALIPGFTENKVTLDYSLKDFENLPNSLGLEISGMVPSNDDGHLVSCFTYAMEKLPPDVRFMYLNSGKVKLVRNNDPEYPPDKLFIRMDFQFAITEHIAKAFIPVAEAFIEKFYAV